MVHKKWTIKEELYSLNMQIREFGGPLRKLVYLMSSCDGQAGGEVMCFAVVGYI